MSASLNLATPAPNRKGAAKSEAAMANEWLDRQIKRGRVERFTEVFDITPLGAAALLEHNTGNRPLHQGRIDQHRKRMQTGTFLLTHSGIGVADTGQLNDGQHRLAAIVAADMTVKMQITFGCDREEFTVVDQGLARTAGHILAIRGKPNAVIRASIVRGIMEIRAKHSQAQDIANYEPQMDQDALAMAITMADHMRRVMPPSSCGIAYYYIATNTKHPGKLPDFW